MLSRFGGLGSSGSELRIDSRFERFGGSGCGAGAAGGCEGGAAATEVGRESSLFGGDGLKADRPTTDVGKGI